MQIIRAVMANKSDKTHIKLLYFSENYNEILYREELDEYEKDGRLTILHTLGEAPENWHGEEGFIDTQVGTQGDALDDWMSKRFEHVMKGCSKGVIA